MQRHLLPPPARVVAAVGPWVRALVLTAVLAGCGGSDDDADVDLSPAAAAGRDVAAQVGCRSCHSVDGRDGVGPTWQGLYGSEVELEGGDTVTADDDYLRRAIVDPEAERVAGYRITMPKVSLDDEQVDEIVAYIKELTA